MDERDDSLEKALNDPDLMRASSELNAAWDQIEQTLFHLFDARMMDEQEATWAVFFSQTSHAARRTMITELAKCVLRREPAKFECAQKSFEVSTGA